MANRWAESPPATVTQTMSIHRFALLVLLVSFVVTTASSARADTVTTIAPDDPITVDLLTMGPGEHPFFKFGHNAIRIRDERRGTDVVYNYGTFSFSSPTLIQDFFKGRLEYWLSRENMAATLAHYAGEDRSLLAQRLALTPAQKLTLKRQLEENARPRNRAYKYDYFFDNCSTRVRDAIDRITDGQLHEAMRGSATQSLRDHALRATADYFLEYLVLSIGLGPLVDKPTDRWAEAFLPEMLTSGVRDATLRDPDGSVRPLVLVEEPLLAKHDERLSKPPRWTLRFLLTGCLCALGLVGLTYLARRSRVTSVLLGASLAVSGFVVGTLGVALVALWTMTDHAVAYRNQNILVLSPLALGLTWVGIRVAARGIGAMARFRWLGVALVASSLVGLALKLAPVEFQDNATLIAFFLPCWAGLLTASQLAKRVTESGGQAAGLAVAPGIARPRASNPRELHAELANSKPER